MPLMTIEEQVSRILARTQRPDGDAGCWLFMGAISRNGYGLTWHRGHGTTTHRFVYAHLRGPIKAGLVVDHLCRVRNCINPDHLEPVTSAENVRRGAGPSGVLNPNRAAIEARRAMAEQRKAERGQCFVIPLAEAPEGVARCRNGHPMIPQNIRLRTERGRQVRRCLTCYRAKKAAEKRKMRRVRTDERKAIAA
jgi:hypothetical protein